MTSKANLTAFIPWIGGAVVIAAIVAGYLTVGSPDDARAYQLDDLRMQTMNAMANVARCAYTATDTLPGSIQELRTTARTLASSERCLAVRAQPGLLDETNGVSYARDDASHIQLCAAFARPTRPDPNRNALDPSMAFLSGYFPELDERRSAAGRHCFHIAITKIESPSDRGTP